MTIFENFFKNKHKRSLKFSQSQKKKQLEALKVLLNSFSSKKSKAGKIFSNYFENKTQEAPDFCHSLKKDTREASHSFKLFQERDQGFSRFFQNKNV